MATAFRSVLHRRALLCGLACSVPMAARAQTAAPRVVELAIVKRKVEGAQVTPAGRAAGVVRVVRGETVELNWTSDEAATLHLHGYDVEARIAAGGKATMRFLARATGRFAIETHGIGNDKGRHLTLVFIEVHPR